MNHLSINLRNRKIPSAAICTASFPSYLGRGIYGGIYVGEDLRYSPGQWYAPGRDWGPEKIKIPVLRWPGGCFADEYHWKDGIGPRENRKKMVNTHWGGLVEGTTASVPMNLWNSAGSSAANPM